jgi:hypothetical protein
VILFPAGWFDTGADKPWRQYELMKDKIMASLSNIDRNIVVCLGMDGRTMNNYAKDQIAIAISKDDVIALGRKYYPIRDEEEIDLATSYRSKERNKFRWFELAGRKYYLCVCYDSFGISHDKMPNFGIDIILNLVHGFYPKGERMSGYFYFTRDGFIRASKQWDCPIFGAAVFFNREIPLNWPSGAYWNQVKDIKHWKFTMNPIKALYEFREKIKEGLALVRIFNL